MIFVSERNTIGDAKNGCRVGGTIEMRFKNGPWPDMGFYVDGECFRGRR